MKKQRWLSFMLGVLILALFPASALALPYGEAAYATNSTGGITWAYGTSANNYVMSDPTLQSPDGKHVNSIYVKYDPNNIIEIGWYRSYPAGSTNPQGFTVRSKNGSYEEVLLGAMTKGQYSTFKIDNTSGTDFKTYINGTYMYTWTSCGFNYGKTRVGCERRYGGSGGDSNYGDFQSLQYKGNLGTWGYWYKINDEDGGAQEDVFYKVYPDDANHKLIIDKG